MVELLSKLFDFLFDDTNKETIRNKIHELIHSKKIITTFVICAICGVIIYVIYSKNANVTITKITISETTLMMNINDSLVITPNVLYSDNSIDRNVVWASSNESVATIDKSGTVTALSEGMATITAQASKNNSVEFAECIVTVYPSSSGDLDLSLPYKDSQSAPRGYSISVHQIPSVDSYAFIYVTPYDSNITKVQLYGKSPSGIVFTPNKDANDLYHFYSECGIWTIYASVENEFGIYEACKPEDFVNINVTNTTDVIDFSLDLLNNIAPN